MVIGSAASGILNLLTTGNEPDQPCGLDLAKSPTLVCLSEQCHFPHLPSPNRRSNALANNRTKAES
jgi:hypothetical protein